MSIVRRARTRIPRATGCTVEIRSPDLEQYAELRNNSPMGLEFQKYMKNEFGTRLDMEHKTTASTDFGRSAAHGLLLKVA